MQQLHRFFIFATLSLTGMTGNKKLIIYHFRKSASGGYPFFTFN